MRTLLIGFVALLLLSTSAHAAPQCVGDCNGDGRVTVAEIVTNVNIALGTTALSACDAGCPDNPLLPPGADFIPCLVQMVNNALYGTCAVDPSPTPTRTPGGY
jgi:hypothetical protein